MSNSKLVFDIETTGVDFESLDEFSREHIQRYAETPEELAEAKEKLGFSPLTGEIAAIGILNPETMKGAVFVRNAPDLPPELAPGVTLQSGSEKEILVQFWTAAGKYNQFISFNGRCFDVPYLMIRSAILGVHPTKNLMANRYLSSQPASALHIDLFDQLSFYGAVRQRSSLHFWTRAFNIPSPKDQGVTGDDVNRLVKEGKFREMAEYNYRDLLATKALYEKWAEYLNF